MIHNKDIRKTKAVYLEWTDSSAFKGWQYPGVDTTPSKICSIGYLLEDKPDHIVITTSLSNTGSFMDALTIPKCAITKRKALRT